METEEEEEEELVARDLNIYMGATSGCDTTGISLCSQFN